MKKSNPKNTPVTVEQIRKATAKEKEKATDTAWAVFANVLFDKHGFTKDAFSAVWSETVRISKAVDNGDIDVNDLIDALDKVGINFVMKPFDIPQNPTAADMKKAKRWAHHVAQSATWMLMLTALKNVENPGAELIKKIHSEMLYLQDSLDKGLIRPKYLHQVLDEEQNIVLC